ncbi:DUF3592 domain-containing protein [Antarctobacter sp.]|uniref:DUF3592 domain-containing protein n=1 Tax=Antarctobacter sp. TaxID=1872577 RepID=UPI002B2740CB|nr:DUF3592 domain-containing protein [Antarctobacter sp.]
MAKVAGDTPVPLWRLFWRMGGWITLIFLVFLGFMTLFSVLSLNLANRFDSEGRETAAEVLDKYKTVTTDSDGDRETTYYFVLQYDTQRGDTVEITRSVGTDIYWRTDPGERIPVWYLESEPDRIEVSRGENRSASVITQWIALVFGIAALVAMWFPARWAVAAVRARRYGARETAQITGTKATNYRVNNRHRYRLTWKEQSGRIGESLAYKEEQLDGYRPGDKITVYQGIKRAWWSGDVGERPGSTDG